MPRTGLKVGLVAGQKFFLKPANIIASIDDGVSLDQSCMQRQCRWNRFNDKFLDRPLQPGNTMCTIITIYHQLSNQT